jgi:hypothetical protein
MTFKALMIFIVQEGFINNDNFQKTVQVFGAVKGTQEIRDWVVIPKIVDIDDIVSKNEGHGLLVLSSKVSIPDVLFQENYPALTIVRIAER